MFNKVLIIVILVLTIVTSGCSPHREHLRYTQVKQIYSKEYFHNCVVNDIVICDSIVTGKN
jgi:hypothetical protein